MVSLMDIINFDDNNEIIINYNVFDIFDFDNLSAKNLLDYVNYINYFINKGIGDYEKNISIQNKFYGILSLKINNNFNMWCMNNGLFIEKPIVHNSNNYLQSNISIELLGVLFSFFNIYEIDERLNNNFENYSNLIISLTTNVKKYFTEIFDKQINVMLSTIYDLDCLIALANDFEIIKNIKNKLNFKEFNDVDMEQINKEFGEIYYLMNLNIDRILEKITKSIILDLKEYKDNNFLENLSIDTILVTLDDYFTDLIIWMLKPNLLKLIEKIDVEIISSNLIIQSSKPRDEFEEFIRLMIEKINLMNNYDQ